MLNTLGPGFLEQVYENALAHEPREAGLAIARQKSITVSHNDIADGDCIADRVADGTTGVELKASKALDPTHTAQCINYLKATGPHPCLRLNFARPRLQIRRVAHEL